MLNLDNWKKAGIYIAVIVGLLTIFYYTFSSFSWVSNKYKSYVLERDLAFSGIWTNPTEGCIGCEFNNDPKKPIVLELKVKDGYVGGVLDASAWLSPESLDDLQSRLPNLTFSELDNIGIDVEKFLGNEVMTKIGIKTMFGFLNVAGKLKKLSAEVVFWDFVDGKKQIFGKGKIYIEGNVLNLTMSGKHFSGIPSTAEMFKIYNMNGNVCAEVHKSEPYTCKN